MDTKWIELIEAVSNARGASGFEDEVVNVLRPFAAQYGTVKEDKLRNLYCFRHGNCEGRPTVQLDAHTDEVSFMVQAIKPDGTLRFLQLGGWVRAGIAGHRVLVRNALGQYIPGITATTPPHYMKGGDPDRLDVDQMSIDVGASSYEEAVREFHIRIGEPVVPDVRFSFDEAHDLMIGKAFDCRLGCAALARTLAELEGESLGVNVVGAWAVQEEVGTRGAAVTANLVRPDVAIIFEGCPADDTVVESYMVQTAIRKGPMLRFMDKRMITHPRFQRFALDIGEQMGIPVQSGVRAGGSTNGAPIHLSNLGVPCIVIGIPVRYIHTQYGMAAYSDFENAARLANAVLRALNEEVIAGF
ncbi:MAG: M42 family peptidase [Clostridia bacterium]|nr:M42 family peptidase [Clostridia bacterium]